MDGRVVGAGVGAVVGVGVARAAVGVAHGRADSGFAPLEGDDGADLALAADLKCGSITFCMFCHGKGTRVCHLEEVLLVDSLAPSTRMSTKHFGLIRCGDNVFQGIPWLA